MSRAILNSKRYIQVEGMLTEPDRPSRHNDKYDVEGEEEAEEEVDEDDETDLLRPPMTQQTCHKCLRHMQCLLHEQEDRRED